MQSDSLSHQLSHEAYTVGWICALPLELTAARSMLDEEHESLDNPPGDDNAYVLGKVCKHNVVIVCLPAGVYGTNSAAVVASCLQSTFRSISISLLVGIGGGIPQVNHDIRLGDVVVGIPTSEYPAVIQYDLGKTGKRGILESKGSLNNPKLALLNAVSKLQSAHYLRHSAMPNYMANALKRYNLGKHGFAYPGSASDILYGAECEHTEDNSACDACGPAKIVLRSSRLDEAPFIHYGPIASGNQVIKHSRTRDRIAQQHGALCFEMEAAGVMNQLQCLVIRGICDYCNWQKNKEFQKYAVLAAAAYAKELLSTIAVTETLGRADTHGLNNEPKDPRSYRKLIMQALDFEDAETRRATVNSAHPQTCKWLLTQKEYYDWLSPGRFAEHHGLLWIKGKPGVGKSTIMKFAVEDMEQRNSSRTTVISFFFNARGRDIARFTVGMYRSLIYQFFKKNEDLQNLLDDFKMVDVFSQDKLHILVQLFRQIILNLQSHKLICFVDALDECPEDQVRDMVKSFEELGNLALLKEIRFLVCFSSRHYPNISVEFARMIVLDAQPGHQEDLSNYIECELRIGKSKRANDLKQDVLHKANGLFLWVILVVKILAREADRGRWHEMETRLDALPQGLNQLFEDILLRDKQNLIELVLCIQWTLYAERPLQREELYFALITARPDLELKPWDRESITMEDIERYILDCSKGLVEYTRAAVPVVQFIHESVREFVSDSSCMTRIDPSFEALEATSSHQKLSECCIRQISIGIPPSVFGYIARRDFPFLSYATEYVLGHIDMAGDIPTS